MLLQLVHEIAAYAPLRMPSTQDLKQPDLDLVYWINAYAVGLEPEKWEKDGLYDPKSDPQDLTSFEEEMKILYSRNALGDEVDQSAA